MAIDMQGTCRASLGGQLNQLEGRVGRVGPGRPGKQRAKQMGTDRSN